MVKGVGAHGGGGDSSRAIFALPAVKLRKSCDFCCQRKRKCDGDGRSSCRLICSIDFSLSFCVGRFEFLASGMIFVILLLLVSVVFLFG